MQEFVLTFCIVFIFQSWHSQATVEVLRPRGVALSNKVFYAPGKDFRCIDGSSVIPFSFVNDDYCDCEDGSDEPGTSACGNAVFHCINSGHMSINIPSSRVNDDICDCCDGGDEYNSTVECVDTCLEMGRQAREEQQKLKQLYEMGHGMWKQYSAQGKQIKEESKAQIENLKKSEGDLDRLKAQKEAIKNEAEDKEKAALDVYKAAKEEQRKKEEELEMLMQQEEERKNAEAVFRELDLDHNDYLSFQELQQFPKFDSDKDGEVSEEEAKFFLHMKDFMNLEEFVSTGWMIMKPIVMMDKQPTPPESSETTVDEREKEQLDPEPLEEEESDDETYTPEEEDNGPLEEEEEEETPPTFPPKESEEAKTEEPEYDEETRRLVDDANEARKQHQEVVDQIEKVKDEIKQLQSFIDADFGKAEEFASLKGQCFDFDDREYTYRFCPFDKASQIAKSGGSDVNLGRWGSWLGPEDNKYSRMKYEGGLTCWNGPARSVLVNLQCGTENKLLSSSEPNRCEYLFEFSTPALCSMNEESTNAPHQHTEL